jgi:DDE superfamily endonuclease/Helix-turn-helix of DDE superfamily endonuclease
LSAFAPCCERLYPVDRTAAGWPRQRFPGGGRTGALHEPGQKLLLLLVYLKTYPPQALLAELFGLSRPRVNYWLRRLLPVLRDALDELRVLPQRDPQAFGQAKEGARRIIDGTERRRQRPKSPEKQALHYSGRKKAHSDKNVVVTDADSGRVEYLSQTYPGRAADKAIADHEGIAYPPGTVLYKDSGFQGYEPAVAKTYQAEKKPRGGELTAAEKRTNRNLGRIRVRVEHALAGVKRCRIVKDVLRNTGEGSSDAVMETACGLYNLRTDNRKRRKS